MVLCCTVGVVRFHSDNTPHYKNVLTYEQVEKRLTKLVVLVVVLGTLEGEV